MKPNVWLDSTFDTALSLVYPRACQICGESVEKRRDGLACGTCWQKVKLAADAAMSCDKCGRVADFNGTLAVKFAARCHLCDGDLYDAARAIGDYAGALRVHVLALKEKPSAPDALIGLFVKTWQQPPLDEATVIIPVPLHRRRRRERGFNQAEILARALMQRAGLPLLTEVLTRETYTTVHRAGMDAQARRESVESAFAVRQPNLVKNQNVLLVDDVMTSGATASACAQTLKENGAHQVFVLTVARVA